MTSRMLGLLAIGFLAAACGDDDEAVCPPGYPVERDGMCYAADDGGDASADGARDGARDANDRDDATPDADTDAAPDADDTEDGATDDGAMDDGGPDDAAMDGDSTVMCMPAHPQFEGARRWCEGPGCYCRAADSCLSIDTAEACCEGPVVCTETAGEDAGCFGVHPIVSSSGRTCEPGNCFCADPDACFPAASASACCNVAVTCFE